MRPASSAEQQEDPDRGGDLRLLNRHDAVDAEHGRGINGTILESHHPSGPKQIRHSESRELFWFSCAYKYIQG
jgi:hypothetical protein